MKTNIEFVKSALEKYKGIDFGVWTSVKKAGYLTDLLNLIPEACDRIEQQAIELKDALAGEDTLLAKIEQHRWIPVSERWPEKEQKNSVMSKEVFVSDGREIWKARCVVSGKRWSYTNSPSATLPITHWKPIILPEQAKAEELIK